MYVLVLTYIYVNNIILPKLVALLRMYVQTYIAQSRMVTNRAVEAEKKQ